jgi:N utilization substance protein B
MLRPETKARARALQLLYARELQPDMPIGVLAERAARLCRGGGGPTVDRAEELANAVVGEVEALDRQAAAAADNWRLSRLSVNDRNILRLAIWELSATPVPAKVAIDEAVRLAHWFGGSRSSGFVNGVLDRVARSLGRL